MNTTELQNNIIKKISEIKNIDFLNFINSLLSKEEKKEYKLTEFEKSIIEESMEEYKSGKVVSNEDVFNKTEKWLEE